MIFFCSLSIIASVEGKKTLENPVSGLSKVTTLENGNLDVIVDSHLIYSTDEDARDELKSVEQKTNIFFWELPDEHIEY